MHFWQENGQKHYEGVTWENFDLSSINSVDVQHDTGISRIHGSEKGGMWTIWYENGQKHYEELVGKKRITRVLMHPGVHAGEGLVLPPIDQVLTPKYNNLQRLASVSIILLKYP